MSTRQTYASVIIKKSKFSSLQESIDIGKHVMETKLAAYYKKVEKFEKDNGMDSKTFIKLFNKGELGDNKKWLKWDHIANAVSLLRKKLNDLENIKYEY